MAIDRPPAPDETPERFKFPRKDMRWEPPTFVKDLPLAEKNFCTKVTDIICQAVGLEFFDRLACAWAIIHHMVDVSYEKLVSKLLIELAASLDLTYDDGIHHRLAELMKETRTPRYVELKSNGEPPVQEMLGSQVELIDLAGIMAVNIYERQLRMQAEEADAQYGYVNLCTFAGMLVTNGAIDRCDDIVGVSRFLILTGNAIYLQIVAPVHYVTSPVMNRLHVGPLWKGQLGFSAGRWTFWYHRLGHALSTAKLPMAVLWGRLGHHHMQDIENTFRPQHPAQNYIAARAAAMNGESSNSQAQRPLVGAEHALRLRIRQLERALAQEKTFRSNECRYYMDQLTNEKTRTVKDNPIYRHHNAVTELIAGAGWEVDPHLNAEGLENNLIKLVSLTGHYKTMILDQQHRATVNL
ncbi:hypothetical protein HYQ46_011038 [Verticillium longisporum]|nr:hypothetical protein HYQ46_011038 [Verticillium longisporum]